MLEGTTASDVPEIPEHKHATTVGKGPSLTVMDSSVIPDPRLVAKLMQLAQKHGIPVQYRRNTAGGTDAGKIQQSCEGVPVAVIALPCRYIHSPVAVASQTDYAHAVKLVKVFLRSLEGGTNNEEPDQGSCESYGPTGFETEVIDKIRAYVTDYVDECYVDSLGN